ncbi:MAG: SDR family oxidoreductase [Clostridiales bacterium]|nr:SDR family oxidoreductase [Clostridiales bacterium]
MSGRMTGKTAVVTGAGSGMGKAIALDFLKEGAKIVGFDIVPTRLEELKQEASDIGLGENVVTMTGDIRNQEDCEAAVKLCVDTFGFMNVLSHNAGVSDSMYLAADIPDEEWDRVIGINLTGSMKITRAALKYFKAKADENDGEYQASIVMITSNAAFESATGGPSYCASKAGANALMKAIAFEYYRYGIRCNSICPGPVLTNISTGTDDFDKEGTKIHLQTGYNASSWQWTGGIIGMPEEISPLAVYLASDESKFMNGNSCVIDSGVCLSR